MPRRTRAFDRSKATNYEVVYRPLRDSTGAVRVYRVVERGNAKPGASDAPPAFDDANALPETDLAYERQKYELGEHGLWDDGYDYAKHFAHIGGKGGVFSHAVGKKVEEPAVAESFTLREEIAEPEEDTLKRRPEDEDLRQSAIDEIRRERKRNADLAEVFDNLDSDGDIASDDGDELAEHSAPVTLDGAEDDDTLLPDDFILLANGEQDAVHDNVVVNTPETLQEEVEEIVQTKRPHRALDDQFEQLLKTYANDDEEDQQDRDWNPDDMSSTEDGSERDADEYGNMDDAMLAELLGSSDYVIDTDEVKDVTTEAEKNEPIDANTASVSEDAAPRNVTTDAHDSFKPGQYAESELTNAMDKLMDSFKRVSAEDAFAAIDGLDGARKAIAKREAEELEAPTDDESKDPELDSMIDDVCQEREEWDCATIISTYSNLDNHPSVIDDGDGVRRRLRRPLPPVIRLHPRTQLPVGGPAAELPHALETDFGARRKPKGDTAKPRNRMETKEEKRSRKAAVKEAARERRAIKSEMKNAFAQEMRVQENHAVALGKSKVVMQF